MDCTIVAAPIKRILKKGFPPYNFFWYLFEIKYKTRKNKLLTPIVAPLNRSLIIPKENMIIGEISSDDMEITAINTPESEKGKTVVSKIIAAETNKNLNIFIGYL